MHDNLDVQAGLRSHDLTARLKNIIDSKMLWDEYGIDDDITVCHSQHRFALSHNVSSHSLPISLVRISTKCYRQTYYIN
jgi:hypothetical protein